MRSHVVQGEAQIRKVAALVLGLNPEKRWVIEIRRHQERRTLSQNKLYFAILTEIAKETGGEKESIHLAMKKKFLPPEVVVFGDEEIIVPGSSAKCGRKEFSDFVERVCAFAASELGIVV